MEDRERAVELAKKVAWLVESSGTGWPPPDNVETAVLADSIAVTAIIVEAFSQVRDEARAAYEEVLTGYHDRIRLLDVEMNGDDAARAPSFVDIWDQLLTLIRAGKARPTPSQDDRERAERADFTCRARNSTAVDPQDCDWPVCGCDPYADRVVAALEERGDGFVEDLATIAESLRGLSKLKVSTVAADGREIGEIRERRRCRELIEAHATAALAAAQYPIYAELVRLVQEMSAP